jgi:hypothetical protein
MALPPIKTEIFRSVVVATNREKEKTNLKENRAIEAQLDSFDVDGVSRDGDSIPTSSHRSIGTTPSFLETELLHLCGGRRDSGFLEDGTHLLAGINGVL